MTAQSRKLLIALDSSKHSDYAYDWYVKYFYKPKDEVVLFHCIEPGTLSKMVNKATGSTPSNAGDDEEMPNPFVAKLQARASASGLKMSVIKSVNNKPGEAIVKASEEQRVDMIITGTRDSSAIRRALMGSVSEYVVHQSNVPVLVVKHG